MASESGIKECSVFIVEDSQMIVGRMTELLEELEGVRFLGNAASLQAALKILSRDKPDAVILDINLGKAYPVNGLELLGIIRTGYPDIKIIMFTNHAGDHYRRLSMDAGADYFFDKSNDCDKIPETMREILQIKKET